MREVIECNYKVICSKEYPNDEVDKLLNREIFKNQTYTVLKIRKNGEVQEIFLKEIRKFVSPFYFISLADWREKQIDDILN